MKKLLSVVLVALLLTGLALPAVANNNDDSFPPLEMGEPILFDQVIFLSLTLTEETRLRFSMAGNRAVGVHFSYAETMETANSVEHLPWLLLHENMTWTERLFPAGEYVVTLFPDGDPGTRALTVNPISTTLVHRVMDFGWRLSAWVHATFPGWLSLLLHILAVPFQFIVLLATFALTFLIELIPDWWTTLFFR